MDHRQEAPLPGYTGFTPNFVKHHVKGDPHRLQNKYADTAKTDEDVLGRTSFKSEYKGASRVKPGMYHAPTNNNRLKEKYEPIPVVGWKSNSHSTIQGKYGVKKTQVLTQESFIGISNNRILQASDMKSSMAADYTTHRGTLKPSTGDILFGTAKAEEGRIPGYSGHTSQSQLLKRKVVGNVRNAMNDRNLTLQAGGYKHNKMGYSGHIPTDFSNDTRRAIPANAKNQIKAGLRTGIVTPSMNLS
mmetsp:Transcript_5992/g.9934  ORF Transcript_5992/g.9934 Transcript_5992/m.9934 type:complete len:245 (-) Transcript_5992:221-955(-)